MKHLNLAVKFLLELAVIAALGYWGASLDGHVLAAIVMIVVPAAVIVLWARFAAPNAPGRLPRRSRIPFELTILLAGALALLAAGQPALAGALAAVIVVNAVLLSAFDQWEG